MPRLLLLFLALLMCSCKAAPPELDSAPAGTKTVHLAFEVPEKTGPVYITGSLPELGPWKPGIHQLEGDGTVRTTTWHVPPGSTVEFKVTAGGWDREALNADGSVPENFKVTVDGEDVTFRATVVRFRDPSVEETYPDPRRWEADIAAFEATDRKSFPPAGAVLFVGSSSIVHWHPTIQHDLAPLTILPRGFGGSMANDLLFYLDRVVFPYNPRAIVIYEGDNDIAGGIFPKTALATMREIIARIHERLPGARVYLVSAKPSPSRAALWTKVQEYNAALKALCAADPLLTYIDITQAMMNAEGKPDPSIFVEDQLHMNPKGYERWTKVVRPILQKAEGGFEKAG